MEFLSLYPSKAPFLFVVGRAEQHEQNLPKGQEVLPAHPKQATWHSQKRGGVLHGVPGCENREWPRQPFPISAITAGDEWQIVAGPVGVLVGVFNPKNRCSVVLCLKQPHCCLGAHLSLTAYAHTVPGIHGAETPVVMGPANR